MGKATGFLEYERKDGINIKPEDRIKNFNEFHGDLDVKDQKLQAARCMDCGVPFCQSASIIGGMASGCPLGNLVPETNDLVFIGNWQQAYERLSKTHSFPEFTSRVCPALCEAACTCNINGLPVATKSNEKAIIEYAFENDLVQPDKPSLRTGKKVAIVGSGPSGLAAAMQLNKRGHSVTVYERSDKVGGLLRYGIPNMKLDKSVIDRRVKLMEESGIEFICNVNVGKDISSQELLEKYDRVILACGASNPRDINVPGRDAKGIYFAVDFLSRVTKSLLDNRVSHGSEAYEFSSKTHSNDCNVIAPSSDIYELCKDKKVLVIGGGDTGNDCVGTAIRLGCASVIQLEMMPQPPLKRAVNNPWPQWPKVLKTDYGQEEAIYKFGNDPRVYQTTVTEFLKDNEGNVCGAKLVKLEGMKPVEDSEETIEADLVLIAAGFLGSEGYIVDDFGVECNERTNVKTEQGSYKTSVERVFTAGDMHRGQSLVVWAIAEGRNVARAVDEDLMGYTNL